MSCGGFMFQLLVHRRKIVSNIVKCVWYMEGYPWVRSQTEFTHPEYTLPQTQWSVIQWILTLVDWSSNIFSLGSTTECSWTYVYVRALPMIWKRQRNALLQTDINCYDNLFSLGKNRNFTFIDRFTYLFFYFLSGRATPKSHHLLANVSPSC